MGKYPVGFHGECITSTFYMYFMCQKKIKQIRFLFFRAISPLPLI